MKFLISLAAFLLVGCAHYSTTQTDLSYDAQGHPERTITTKVSVSTFWDSTSELAKSRATQTDKSQSAALGSLNQSSTSTNVNALVEGIVSSAVSAAVKSTIKP